MRTANQRSVLPILVVLGLLCGPRNSRLLATIARDPAWNDSYAEDDRGEIVPLSEFNAKLAAAQKAGKLAISPEQADSISRLNSFANEVMRERRSSEPASVQPEKPGTPPGDEQKIADHLAASAEVIAMTAIFSPEQWSIIQRDHKKRSSALPSAHSRPHNWPPPMDLRDSTIAELRQLVKGRAATIQHNGSFSSLVTLISTKRYKSACEITDSQKRLIADINLLSKLVLSRWLLREIENAPRPKLTARLNESGQYRTERVAASLDRIVLETILSREQSELARLIHWRSQGSRALLDPVLANRLALTKAQVRDIALLLNHKDEVVWDAELTLGPLRSLSVYGRGAEADAAHLEIKQITAAAEGAVWEALTPKQYQRLQGLFHSIPQ